MRPVEKGAQKRFETVMKVTDACTYQSLQIYT